MELKTLRGLQRLVNRRFDFLIFFVTSICNAKCGHCFYWKNLNAPDEGFPLADVEKLARSMPPFRTLLISGGEPFLREDLPAVIQTFWKHNHIEAVSIPSNGILAERTTRLTREICQISPELDVTVNLSIDGFAPTHDHIRGVPRNFEMTIQTLERLLELRTEFDNFDARVNTVICAANYTEVIDFARDLAGRYPLGGHFFEIIRGNGKDPALHEVPPEALKSIYTALIPIQREYLRQKMHRNGMGVPGRLWRETQSIGGLLYQYRTQYGNYADGCRWDISCSAGETIGVIDYNANVRVCELRSQSVNLREYDYNFSRLWADVRLELERQAARSHQCDCTHVCFISSAMQHSPTIKLWLAPWLYGRYLLTGKW